MNGCVDVYRVIDKNWQKIKDYYPPQKLKEAAKFHLYAHFEMINMKLQMFYLMISNKSLFLLHV